MIGKVTLLVMLSIVHHLNSNPIILKESSPSGEAVVAISSSDPNIEKYLSFNFPSASTTDTRSSVVGISPEDFFKRSFSFVAPGQSAAGTGRSFVSTSNFNPFLLPIFNWPINLEGLGLNNFGVPNNRIRGAEGFYEPAFAGNGEVQAVTAVNDNGHVYGKVKTITFDNKENI